MSLRVWVVVFFAVVASAAVRAEPLPHGFSLGDDDVPGKPVTKDGTVTFRILDQQCSPVLYGDDRGESDCTNGNIRSDISFSPPAKMGQTMEYRFDTRTVAP